MFITIITADGCAPRTTRVTLDQAATHIAANDRLADEAKALLAYASQEEDIDPIGFDPISGEFVFVAGNKFFIPVEVR